MCEYAIVFNFKIPKILKLIKLLIQQRCIWLLVAGVLFVALVCGYQHPAELVCSVCVQIIRVASC
jgi:hypothetical protein